MLQSTHPGIAPQGTQVYPKVNKSTYLPVTHWHKPETSTKFELVSQI